MAEMADIFSSFAMVVGDFTASCCLDIIPSIRYESTVFKKQVERCNDSRDVPQHEIQRSILEMGSETSNRKKQEVSAVQITIL